MARYREISANVLDCETCPTRCDGISKGVYSFEDDVRFSEEYENRIIEHINRTSKKLASKSVEDGYPDITIRNEFGEIESYLEVKVQRRTFMSVKKMLPKSGLKPSETLALNLSDLLRYFEIRMETNKPISILWVLAERPCIVNDGEVKMYHQSTEILEEIYHREKNKRRFRRKSGKGDVVEGEHKGVVVNYHFSLNELKLWKDRL